MPIFSTGLALSADLAAVLYTVSAVLFILALRGLSSPETSRRGNTFGMIGIAIAIVTTLARLIVRAGPRRSDWRSYIFWFGYRLRQTQRQYERCADYASRAAHH